MRPGTPGQPQVARRLPAGPARGLGNGPLSLTVGRSLGAVVVTLDGDLDRAGSPYLAAVLDDLIDGQGNLAVVLDLRGVGRIDRSAVEVVAVAGQKIDRRGGELVLAGASRDVRDALAATGLTPLSLHPAGSNWVTKAGPPSNGAGEAPG